jgi:hypothetical protein
MKRIKVFEASHNADNIEGRGPSVHDGYFVHEGDANRASRGKGTMGQGSGDVKPVELTIFDTFEEYAGEKQNELRLQALGKLTKAERHALGFGCD